MLYRICPEVVLGSYELWQFFSLALKAAILKKKKKKKNNNIEKIIFLLVFSFLEQWPEIIYKYWKDVGKKWLAFLQFLWYLKALKKKANNSMKKFLGHLFSQTGWSALYHFDLGLLVPSG